MLWENKKVWLEIAWEGRLFLPRVFLSFTTGNVEFYYFVKSFSDSDYVKTVRSFGFLMMFSVWSKRNIGKKRVNYFAQICLMLEVKFADKS